MPENEKFEIAFYCNQQGKSEIIDWLDNISLKAETNKSERINYNSVLKCFEYLREDGTRRGMPTVRHLQDNIWELRPNKYRILFAYWQDSTYVALHYFTKKTQKTPQNHIDTAKKNFNNFINKN